jgi:hypothetical protein
MKKKVERNPDKPYEDMDGNWIGLGYGRKSDIGRYNRNYEQPLPHLDEKRGAVPARYYANPDIEKGEIEILEKKCREGDEEACDKLIKIEKDNEDFLEHLMAIADYDEYPPKLKEPSDKE